MKGFRAQTPPLWPQKPYFLRHLKNAEILKFSKMQVFSGPEGGVWVSKHPKQFYISIFIILGGLEAKKCHFSKILIPENSNFLSFQGPQGVPLRFFLAKNGSKSSVLPWIEKSWPFGPQKIALKESYGGFPLGGASKAPPPNRVNTLLMNPKGIMSFEDDDILPKKNIFSRRSI